MTKRNDGIHNNLVSDGKGSQLFTNGKTLQMTYFIALNRFHDKAKVPIIEVIFQAVFFCREQKKRNVPRPLTNNGLSLGTCII
jgi:hypothetical protein